MEKSVGIAIPYEKRTAEPTIIRIAANGKHWDLVLNIAILRVLHFPEKDRPEFPVIKLDSTLVIDVKEVHELGKEG